MNKRSIQLLSIGLLTATVAAAQQGKSYEVKSRDGNVSVKVEAGDQLLWSVQHKGQPLITPSAISLESTKGVLGKNPKVTSAPVKQVNTTIKALNYKKASIIDQYNELTLNCKGDYGVVFRVYNDAVAYRFFTRKKGELLVKNEEATFNFPGDQKAFLPIQWDYRGGQNFNSSFEALYREINLSQFPKDSLAFLPLLVEAGQNKKVVILEADLEDYPGMYLNNQPGGNGLKGVYAPYPLEVQNSGYNNINLIPTKRADYIAKTTGTRNFPWRAIAISEQDKELLNNDIVQKLAAPSRIADASWIEPGQVAWDWWNSRDITHVDFKVGLNTDTYKYFIDFAAANKVKYIVIDGGWTPQLDLFQVRPELDLQQVIDYGKQKNVGVVLWASWNAVVHQMDKAFPHYAKMGAKGFKIDFIDRDDQVAVASLYQIARKAAEHKLLVDYHGSFKPTGLHRTYPNVMGYEGVKGLENYKWADEDQPRYAVTIPYIRMMAGPMDYTPGAMRNVNQLNYRAIGSQPMSKGTRCQQLAMYVIYEAPLQMLSDSPTAYQREQECTDFIVKVPVTFDETVPLDGKVGEYVALARRKGDTWHVGAMTNWTPRDLTLDFSFLPEGTYEAEIFKDGINADRNGTDYKREVITVSKTTRQLVKLGPGGGWAARIYRK
ncbi:MAG TPA: glycoside hydrolase family 97 protein [Hymenobacter sp.]|jgi:alpha-glucosidase|uniref:glycoside hydrolase family 97 protein n=1 Tax=Hymenobacter sp. TaxID=1898978 RepID=UPI002ED7D965